MTGNTTSLLSPIPDEGETASDEPDPSPLTLLVPHDAWHALGDVEGAVADAMRATSARIAGISGRDVAVVLTSDAEVRTLNAQFRNQDKPTNVLSFPATDNFAPHHLADEPLPLGDIIIAHETVLREAGDEGKPPLHHLTHLTVHGLLHLAGFDHGTDAEAERMEALESDILASLDIPDPYLTTRAENGPSPADGCTHHD